MLQNILQKLYSIEHIPSHPVIRARLQDVLSGFDPHNKEKTDELTRFISYDPSLMLELLKIANSDSFGFRNKISSIENALLIMERDLIELVISQHPVIPNLEAYKEDSEFIKLIKHSIEVHSFVQMILERIPKNKLPDDNVRKEILTASILHDMGLIFLLIYFPDYYTELIKSIKMSENVQIKSHSFIPDHSLISSVLCEYWHLPANITSSISFHHYPWTSDESCRLGAEILYAADTISNTFYELYYGENDVYTIDEHIVMRRNLLDILERLEIDIIGIAEMRIQSAMTTDDLYSDLGL